MAGIHLEELKTGAVSNQEGALRKDDKQADNGISCGEKSSEVINLNIRFVFASMNCYCTIGSKGWQGLKFFPALAAMAIDALDLGHCVLIMPRF